MRADRLLASDPWIRPPSEGIVVIGPFNDLHNAGSGNDAAHRGGMTLELEALARVSDDCPLHLENRDVVVHVVANIKVLAVRAEDRAFPQAAYLHLPPFGDPLSIYLQP